MEETTFNAPQLTKGGKHEENAIEHCFGSSGIDCVGTNHAAATYEDARRAAAAADDDYGHYH